LIQQDTTGSIFQYVYVGDTGELDQEAGETMLREYPQVVKAVFLHVVSDLRGEIPIPPPKLVNGRPIIFFRTYVGAAVAAVKLGFMGVEGLRRVLDAACIKLDNVSRDSDKWADLAQDIKRANELL
jgi:CTP:molybdopterin cytidylyltransferase MocA